MYVKTYPHVWTLRMCVHECMCYLKCIHMCCYQWRCHQSGWSDFHLTTFTEGFIDVRKYRKYFYKYYTQISPINAWMMLTGFNCWSATYVKNAVVFCYIHAILYTLLCLRSIVLSIFVMKCILKLPYLNYLKSLTSSFQLS